jgi:Arc/MetJ-type ribon-helix-helix transcriptional regulator
MATRIEKDNAAKLEALRAALDEGENSGYLKPFDFDKFIESMRERSNRKNKTKKNAASPR